jgi:CRP/FNR family transcriptional regulator
MSQGDKHAYDRSGRAASRFSLVARSERVNLDPGCLISPCDKCEARNHSACAYLDAAEQKRVVSIMNTVTIEARRPLFDEAEPAEYVYNVTSGALKIYKLLPDGRRQITGFLFPGDFVGLVHNDVYAYSAEALTRTDLCRFPRHKLESLLTEIPQLERRLLGMASHELAAAQDQMMLLGRKSARERVVSFLLMLSDSGARRGRPADTASLPMTRTDIGDYLGLTIETVSRVLSQLKRHGLITLLDDKQVLLANLPALRQIATGS